VTLHSFNAILIRPDGVGTWTFLNIPLEVSSSFGTQGQVKVKGTINGYPYQSTALPMGDSTHYLVVNKSIRDVIHATQGDTVSVTMELDLAERRVELPDELAQALASRPELKDKFEKLPISHQKEYVTWIQAARRADTRQRRVVKTIERLSQGKNLPG
jgi:Domain of unknown function (DUF1905)/Bacteriocin-protection, YdeI or OmpD-Associated